MAMFSGGFASMDVILLKLEKGMVDDKCFCASNRYHFQQKILQFNEIANNEKTLSGDYAWPCHLAGWGTCTAAER